MQPKLSSPAVKPPSISSTAAILMDAETGKILYSRNANARLPVASTTKIMTAMVALENLPLDKRIKISARAANAIGSRASLQEGEIFTAAQLLYALLVVSGNDAAIALAEATSGKVEKFVDLMNAKAEKLGLKNTHFTNPTGVNSPKHFSSAKDLATLTRYALQNRVFRSIVSTRDFALPPLPDGTKREFHNHNVLLHELAWVNGVKTGSTPYAKYCVVLSATYEGVSLIGVILGAQTEEIRWKEARALLEYGLSLYPRTLLCDLGQPVAELDIGDLLGRSVRLVTDRPLVTRLHKDETAVGSIKLNNPLPRLVHAGDDLGVIEYTCAGRSLGYARLIAAQSVDRPSIRALLDRWQKGWAPALLLGLGR
ncbi:MAG: D-alanyl-D-alanine carboxypeptidase [Thermoleophilia bacterium]|nr:D-alanyl-D-alanine carboxypeptidase [Thermoleophilia bacterium]